MIKYNILHFVCNSVCTNENCPHLDTNVKQNETGLIYENLNEKCPLFKPQCVTCGDIPEEYEELHDNYYCDDEDDSCYDRAVKKSYQEGLADLGMERRKEQGYDD